MTSFFFIDKNHTFLIHSSFVGHLAWYLNLVVVTRAAINPDVQASLWCVDLGVFGINIQEWYWSYEKVYYYGFRNLHTDFHGVQTSLYPHQQCIGVPFAHILSTIGYFLTGVRWNLIVGLICLSLWAREVEYFFMYSSAIYTSSLRTVHLFGLFIVHFLFVPWTISKL